LCQNARGSKRPLSSGRAKEVFDRTVAVDHQEMNSLDRIRAAAAGRRRIEAARITRRE